MMYILIFFNDNDANLSQSDISVYIFCLQADTILQEYWSYQWALRLKLYLFFSENGQFSLQA